MIRVLVISLEFPPVNSTGCYRYLKFIRYFREFGIEPIVIAPTVESSLQLWENRKTDDSLLSQIPANTEIHRIPLPMKAKVNQNKYSALNKAKGYFKYKDNAAEMWKPGLKRCIEKLKSNQTFDALFISAPPFSLCKLGVELSNEYRLPLILDMRDDWILNKGYPYLTLWHYWSVYQDLQRALSAASELLFVTSQLIDITKKVFPSIASTKCTVVNNGFDLDSPEYSPIFWKPKCGSEKIRIGYAGEFYFDPIAQENSRKRWWARKGIRKLNYQPGLSLEDWKYRSPYFFLKTLRTLFDQSPEWKDRIFFEYIGNPYWWLNEQMEEFGLKENFVSHGFVAKSKNLQIQKSFDLLLCTSEKIIDGESYCISSKLFDAVTIGKPILGFVTNGAAKDFISQSGCGVVLDPDNVHHSAAEFSKFLLTERKFVPNKEYLSTFEPKRITSRASAAIHRAVEKTETASNQSLRS